jgi:glycosyltransferase involved in cell wall biosynthesis
MCVSAFRSIPHAPLVSTSTVSTGLIAVRATFTTRLSVFPMKMISICIPVYNEAENIPVVVEVVESLFRDNLSTYALEFVVTDNASTDHTWQVIQRLASTRTNLRAFRFARNFGYQNSVFAGLFMATGDAVIELDADLEDPPHVILEFIRLWEEGYDVAYGVRSKRFAPWYLQFLFSAFYAVLTRLSDLKIPQNAGDFRLLDRKVLDALKQFPERNLYLRGLVTFIGFRQIPVIYERHPRLSGSSKFRFFHYFALAIDALTAFSKTPLRLIGVCGLGLFVLAMGLAGYYLYGHFVSRTPVPGFTTLVVLTLLLHSITLIFLGVLGEYLSRIFDDAKRRPRVIIAEAVNAPDFPRVL